MDEDNNNYDDEQFEEDDELQSIPEGTSHGEIVEPQQQSGLCSWNAISDDEIDLGEQLGGGSMGLVHRGTYKGRPVAVKTLVSPQAHPRVVPLVLWRNGRAAGRRGLYCTEEDGHVDIV